MFIDFIKEKNNEFVDYCNNYANQNICLFGAGLGAYRVWLYLRNKGVDALKIAVNSNYVETAQSKAISIWGGASVPKIEAFENLMSDGNIYDVVVTFSGWDMDYFRDFDNTDRVFNLDIFSCLPEKGSLSTVSYEYYLKNKDKLERVYTNLADEKSKKCFISFINQRISGHYNYSDGLVDKTQYYDDSIFSLGRDELFVDCGAYDGIDTNRFFERAGNNSKAIVIEPDPDSVSRIRCNLKNYEKKYSLINKGVLDKNCILRFKSDGSYQSKLDADGDIEISCATIDSIVGGKKVTYIKMDIEGTELKALKGAERTIKNDSPRLAICIYHKPEDLFEIPLYIMDINPNYKFYIRRYDVLCSETVLFAVV